MPPPGLGSAAIGSTDALGNYSGPNITEDGIRNLIRNGQGYVASVPGYVTATNPNLIVCSMSLFNPAASTKTILIYSIKLMINSSNISASNTVRQTTVDPSGTTGFTGVITPVNLKTGGPASVASLCSSASAIAASVVPTGTFMEQFGVSANTITELLANGAIIVLPVGVASGLEVTEIVLTAGNLFGATVKWLEF